MFLIEKIMFLGEKNKFLTEKKMFIGMNAIKEHPVNKHKTKEVFVWPKAI